MWGGSERSVFRVSQIDINFLFLRRGEVIAVVQRVIMNMEIRQMVGGGTSPELVGEGEKKKKAMRFYVNKFMFISSFSSFLFRRLSRGGGGRRAGPHDGVGATQLGCEEVGGKHLKTKKNIGEFHVPRSPSLLARALKAFLRRHLRSYLEKEGRELIAQELEHAAQEQQQQHQVGVGGYFFLKKILFGKMCP